jgi:release factor glutamine methyltransferase
VAAPPWTDTRGRTLYPLPFPRLDVEPGVVAPAAPSFMAWRHLFQEGIGAGRRCLDVGCGTGILGVQLALNNATHVHCIDIDERAVSNTLANAFRNDVSDRLTAAAVDLYPWVPEERYEVVVACLAQKPSDPFEAGASHRRSDYWGRMLLEQLIVKLPDALAPEGTAYVVQLSIVSQEHTAALLAAAQLEARVVDYEVCGPAETSAQIERVEALSDAYHLTVGDDSALVAYLLEIRHAE